MACLISPTRRIISLIPLPPFPGQANRVTGLGLSAFLENFSHVSSWQAIIDVAGPSRESLDASLVAIGTMWHGM